MKSDVISREEIKENAKQRIDKIFRAIDEAEAKKDSVAEDAKEEYKKMMYYLNYKKIELQEMYNEVIDSSDEKLDEVATTFDSAATSFNSALAKLRTLFH
jgi:hypothetical protein